MGLLDVLGLPPRAKAAPSVSSEEAAYQAERAAVALLADALRAHPQAARIRAQTTAIGTHQGQANYHASKKDWGGAMKDLAQARAGCVAAQKDAAAWAAYARQLATANAKVRACEGVFGDTDVATAKGQIAAAAAKVSKSPPDFAGATSEFAKVDATLKPSLQDYVATQKGRLTNIQATSADAQAFVAKEVAAATAALAKSDAAAAAGDWSQAMMSALAANEALAPAERYAARRDMYERQREATVADISSIQANPETRDRAEQVQAMLVRADQLAGHETMKIEQAARLLVEASTLCSGWRASIATIAAHDSERRAAEGELAGLARHPAAAQVQAQRDAIGRLLQDAAAAAAQARQQPDAAATWTRALDLLRRARADLAMAKKLAETLVPNAAAEHAAQAKPPNVAALKKTLADLIAGAAAAGKAPDADQAAEPLARFKEHAKAAATALGKNDAAGAAASLLDASEALAQARTIQSQHGQFAASLGEVEDKLKALQALPVSASIKGPVIALSVALAEAKKQDAAHAGAAAMDALRRAGDAAATAEQAGRDRSAFDAEARKVADRIKAEVADANGTRTMQAALASATNAADGLRFAEAKKALDAIDVKLDAAKITAGAARRPPDPAIVVLASRMANKGGAAAVDALIQSQPDSIDPKVIDALATGRFGVKFTTLGSNPGANEVKAMKRMCQMFATVSGDIRGNPSILAVTHVDATSRGGAYVSDDAKIEMKGRVRDRNNQKFGANLTARDPKSKKEVSQLPKDIDPRCRAKDENREVEFMSFAAAHEVGHGLDDERAFMAQHLDDPAKGGWRDHGNDIEPVAVAIGADIAAKFPASSFNKSPESRKYVRDKIANRPGERPSAAKGSADSNAYDAFDRWHAMATAENVYRRQPDCDAITMLDKRIYHEAYARHWVSYVAAARAQGLTGYQFRAPGEWFAELYAGWKSGKLGDKHPALEWLTKV